jgi:cytochrome c oxidase subunit 2
MVGEYKVRCAELCGRNHALMLAPVSILSQADFDAWIQEQLSAIPDDPVERGKLWSRQFGCGACHSVDGSTIVGPSWLGIFGSEVELADGSTTIVDQSYIRESILQPGNKIVAGFDNVMPPDVGAQLNESQIDDIIAYIQSLQ